MNTAPRIALAHHWLVGQRGGEKVLEEISQLFPGAPLYTLVVRRDRLSPRLRGHPLHPSWLQRLPGGVRHYKKLLPLFPSAVSSLRVAGPVNLILSSDASVIKGLGYPEGILHVCYCHSPPRYLWDLPEDYAHSSEVGGPLGRALFKSIIPYLRDFDYRAANRVTHFIANSAFVRERIRRIYGRESTVIHPPVALQEFHAATERPDNFYLIVSQLVPYKRIDLAVQAFNQLGLSLVVIGEGSERRRLMSGAGPTITFLGAQKPSVLQDYYRRCRALIFPGVEDFGLTPLEAMASGRPVIAYGQGGALETILDGVTGRFFMEQPPESLILAVERFSREQNRFEPQVCRRHAEQFSPERFRSELKSFLQASVGL